MRPLQSFTAMLAVAVLLLAAPSLASAHWATAFVSSGSAGTPPQTLALSGPSGTIPASTATFSFSSSVSGSTFVCSLDGHTPAACSSPQTVHGLTNGQHTFQAWAVSPTGQPDPTGVTWTFAVQVVTPRTLALSGPSGTIAANTATFSFASSVTGSTFVCSLDGQSPTPCSSPQNVHSLNSGQHTFQAWAVSPAGQPDPTGVTWTFTVQIPAPQTTAVSGPTGTINTGDVRFQFDSSQASSTFLCALDGQSPTPCSSPQTIHGLSNGQHTFRAWAVNSTGHQDPTGVTWTFTVQIPAPQTVAISGPTGTINSGDARFHFGSPQRSSSFVCALDGAIPSPCSSTVTLHDLSSGPHTFQAWAVSPSGQPDPTGVTWTFTVQAPPGPIDPPSMSSYVATVGQTVTCQAGSWSGQPAISYRWYRNGTPITGPDASTDYTVQRADSGQQVSCHVLAANSAGTRDVSAGTVQVEQFMLLSKVSFPASLRAHHQHRPLPALTFLSSNSGRVQVNLISCRDGCSRAIGSKAFSFATGINRLHLPAAWRRHLKAGTYKLMLHASTPFGDQQATVQLQVVGTTVSAPTSVMPGTSSSQLPPGANWALSAAQRAFAARLAAATGLDAGVVAAWVASEEPASAAHAPNGANNWLNIGCYDAGNWGGGGASVWRSPTSGADATSTWLHGGSIPGVGYAAQSIRDIIHSVGASPQAQIQAIQRSGWASSRYPNLGLTYRELQA